MLEKAKPSNRKPARSRTAAVASTTAAAGPEAAVRALRDEAARHYQSDAAAARRLARQAVELAQRSGDPTALGWGYRALAESLLFSGRFKDSAEAYSRAAEAWRKSHDNGPLGQLLVGRLHVLTLLGRTGLAERTAREARRLLERSGDTAYQAKLAMNLAVFHFQRDAYRESLQECERASGLFAELGLRDQSVLGLEINRAVALTQLDEHDAALGLFDKLDAECGRGGYELLRAQVRMNSAYVHSLRAEYDVALSLLSRALHYFRRTDHPAFLASSLLNRADVYQQLNLHDEAREQADEARALFAKEGMVYDEALALHQRAVSSLALGDHADALSAIRRGLTLHRRKDNRARIALLQTLAAEAELGRRRPGAARGLALQAAGAFRRLALPAWEALATAVLCRSEVAAGTRVSIARAERLLSRHGARLSPLSSFRLLEVLGDAQERAGRDDRALRMYERALRHLEGIRARIPTEDSKLAFIRDKAPIYDRILALELRRPRPSVHRILETMEQSRAQPLWDRFRRPTAFLDAGSEASIDAGSIPLSAETTRRLRDLRRELSWLNARVSSIEMGPGRGKSQLPGLRTRLRQAESDWARLLREAGEESHLDTPTSDGASEADVERISNLLPRGWGFLSYHLGPGFALALVITREGATWRSLAPDLGPRLDALSRRLDFQWGAAALASAHRGPGQTDSSVDPLLRTTEALLTDAHRLLWQPIEELGLDPELRWLVAPHGAVHRIPMHALLGAEGYLAERTVISVVPSARVWQRMTRWRPGRAPRAWVGGVASPYLPAVELEVDRVCRRLDGWRVTSDLAPTRAVFREATAQHQLVHLAAHGALRPNNPAFSSIQLGDGPFFVYDLTALQLPGSLVVLTACSSGRGQRVAGDEWVGLGRGFLQAGASAVVTSLWPIEDQSTYELMDFFYASLQSGQSPAEALAVGMRQLRAARPHPWQWGAFAMLGGL